MPASDAQKRASQKWEKEKVDQFRVRLPKGKKDILQICAEINDESVNAMINRLIDDEINNIFNTPENSEQLNFLIEKKLSTISDSQHKNKIEDVLAAHNFFPHKTE